MLTRFLGGRYQGNMQRICSNQHKEGITENHGTDSTINDIFGT